MLVDMARKQVVYPTSWLEVPGRGPVRLGMTIGLSVADPCRLAAQALLESPLPSGIRPRTRRISDLDWTLDHVRASLPTLLADALHGTGGDAGAVVRMWPELRRGLSSTFDGYGLVVQEVWLRDLTALAPKAPVPVPAN